ncbi:hypothetical protein RR48_01854 [Papilio machaon]|uniref:Uncharacterized protein n=1 Tax=Papilio machaon TaxID=76193 RepID=A0A0N0PDL3_PAPMA|nr:hypothetical protein RR48_01854 [Papilio machaon]
MIRKSSADTTSLKLRAYGFRQTVLATLSRTGTSAGQKLRLPKPGTPSTPFSAADSFNNNTPLNIPDKRVQSSQLAGDCVREERGSCLRPATRITNQTDSPKRHCPTLTALPAKSEDLLSLLLGQQIRQNKMFEGIVQLSQNQEEKISKIETKLDHSSPDSAPEDLNVSFADSTHSENRQDEDDEEVESNATPPNIWAPIESNDADENKGAQISQEESLRIQIIDAQRKLLELQKENPQHQTTETNIDFSPLVVESQVKIVKADSELAKQGSTYICQRLGEDTWKNIRYADVQKQFQATPVNIPDKRVQSSQLAGDCVREERGSRLRPATRISIRSVQQFYLSEIKQ